MRDLPSRLEHIVDELRQALLRQRDAEPPGPHSEQARLALTGSLEIAERHLLALQASGDGVWDWDVAAGTVYFSETAQALIAAAGSPPGQRLQDWLERLHPDDRESLRSELASHVEGRRASLHNEHRVVGADGAERWVL